MKKENIIQALRKFINQRSGISFADYNSGDWKSSRDAFFGDYRPMLREGRDARLLLNWISGRDGITAENIIEASQRAFSGRLTIKPAGDGVQIDYTTGQYFPTEYRAAACSVLARVVSDYLLASVYDWAGVQKQVKNEFGRGIFSRWFN